MNELILVSLCIGSGLLVIYHHFGYPLFLVWYSRHNPKQDVKRVHRGYRQRREDRARPSITVLIPAHNEERWIADKIRNLAMLDYPRDRLKIIIACDGCTDSTVEVAESTIQEAACSDIHFEIRVFSCNRGKIAVLNEQMLTIDTDITALSDVSALISIDALLIAEQHFLNPKVGVVNSSYRILSTMNEGEAKYWQYQSKIKQCEAALGSTLGAHGALYLLRTHLFSPLDPSTINDDFVVPMEIIQKGYVVQHEQRMIALEMESTRLQNDLARRLRISAGNMQQAIRLAELFLPRYRGVAFAFASGKGLRLITPYLMLTCLACSIALMDLPIFMAALVLQCIVYGTAVVTSLFPSIFDFNICRLLTYLVAGHCVNFIGGIRYLLGYESGRWTRVNR
ncbi:glycosyltransferase family 2 protein [Vibrio profundum]|uniref:glycosyltransferase family 2 protein n=1 Tax=Vibrio profundum TaxID=2910247 RepID=UPI003D13AD4B